MPEIHAVYCVNAVEFEKDQGPRPDGHTLHASLEIARAHCAAMTAGRGDTVAHTYTNPGTPHLVEVDAETYAAVMAAGTIVGHHSRHFVPARAA